jgi:hypothetical protein
MAVQPSVLVVCPITVVKITGTAIKAAWAKTVAGIGASTRARIEVSNIVKGALSGKEKEVDIAYCVLDDDASWRMSSIN